MVQLDTLLRLLCSYKVITEEVVQVTAITRVQQFIDKTGCTEFRVQICMIDRITIRPMSSCLSYNLYIEEHTFQGVMDIIMEVEMIVSRTPSSLPCNAVYVLPVDNPKT